MKYLSARELLDGGYVQEANRLFFHPMGLALEVLPQPGMAGKLEDELGPAMTVRVWDCRDDPEGVRFEGYAPEALKAKATAIAAHHAERRPVREAELGYWIQPV